jgi:hypothetical protein
MAPGLPTSNCSVGAGSHVVPPANKPNHLLMRAWSLAVLARKLALQALRQKRSPQWVWLTRPNFPPQFAQRLFNLVMSLSSNLEVVRAMLPGAISRYGDEFVASSACKEG